ncbi:Vacuolar sorting protein 9 [Macleaya cordata]|uniref:Vacuolar sorting protein 9 n=1 Tax=Macleaya cordata TaxID=56857 RepID=A0A200Q2S8_MACCD|nr:Vacuolar sorting protein 9 [Macleaya cordata]
MENADVFGSSTAQLTWHDFLERMRHPSAAEFVKSIKSFIVSFSNNASDPERDSAAVQEFLANMEGAFRAHSLWAGCSEEELESAGEGLEKYVMTKLFPRVFASLPEDVKFDEQLSEKMAFIQQFIRPENLDIKPTFQNETSWLLAQKELQKINMYKAPRDKLVCILSCCKVINNLLLNASIASNENPPGADEFLPVLIFVTIKANPPQLHSNLLYIQRYRSQSRLVSEAAYFFTNMLSAESFISNIDAKSISMDETEFENNMESARAVLSGLANDSEGLSNQSNRDVGHIPRTELIETKQQSFNANKERNNLLSAMGYRPSPQASTIKSEDQDTKDHVSITRKPSISDLENKGATELLKEDQMSRAFHEYPYLYAQVGDLTVDDVEGLLNSYKQLVLKYVCLSKGMAITSPPLPLPIPQIQTETEKQPEDIRSVEENYKKHEDMGRKDEVTDEGSLLQMETSESKIPEDESVRHQDGEKENIFQ